MKHSPPYVTWGLPMPAPARHVCHFNHQAFGISPVSPPYFRKKSQAFTILLVKLPLSQFHWSQLALPSSF